ncbi:MAG: hypothetical protein SPH96_04130 [Agathobacter sp.]|nr:hypothetical protein [Agathobacter sp.]
MAVENSVKDLRKERKETQKDLAMNEKQSLIAGNKKCHLQNYHSKELSLTFKLDVSKLSKNLENV